MAALLALGAVTARDAGAQSPPPAVERFLRLEDLERMALERNPTVAQADAVVRSVLGRKVQAGLYPNPLIGYAAEDINTREPGRGKHFFFVQQSIVTGGKRRHVQEAVAQEQIHAETERAMQRQRVLNAVRVLFYETLGAARTVELRRELARIGREAVQISEDLYNIGQADRPDVIEVEIEAERMDLDLARAESDLERSWRELAAMIGEPAMPMAPLAGDLEAEVPSLDPEAVQAHILRESPELKIARSRVEHARASLARVRADRIPNFFVRAGAGYNAERFAPGKDVGAEFKLEIGVPLPLFDRNQGNIATAEAQVSLAEAELRRTELALRGRLASALKDYQDSLRTVQRYQTTVLARAQRAYELYLARFRQMAAAYPQVLIAQRTLGQVRAEYVRALVDAWQNAIVLQGGLVTGGLSAPEAVPGEPPVIIEAVPFTVTP